MHGSADGTGPPVYDVNAHGGLRGTTDVFYSPPCLLPLTKDESVNLIYEVPEPAMVLKNRQYRHKKIPSDIKTFISISIS